jgi:hypothetical protein
LGCAQSATRCCWAGLAPGIFESAGKRHQPEQQHGNKWLTAMLVEAAGSVGRMKGKNYLSAEFARLISRRGMGPLGSRGRPLHHRLDLLHPFPW